MVPFLGDSGFLVMPDTWGRTPAHVAAEFDAPEVLKAPVLGTPWEIEGSGWTSKVLKP